MAEAPTQTTLGSSQYSLDLLAELGGHFPVQRGRKGTEGKKRHVRKK